MRDSKSGSMQALVENMPNSSAANPNSMTPDSNPYLHHHHHAQYLTGAGTTTLVVEEEHNNNNNNHDRHLSQQQQTAGLPSHSISTVSSSISDDSDDVSSSSDSTPTPGRKPGGHYTKSYQSPYGYNCESSPVRPPGSRRVTGTVEAAEGFDMRDIALAAASNNKRYNSKDIRRGSLDSHSNHETSRRSKSFDVMDSPTKSVRAGGLCLKSLTAASAPNTSPYGDDATEGCESPVPLRRRNFQRRASTGNFTSGLVGTAYGYKVGGMGGGIGGAVSAVDSDDASTGDGGGGTGAGLYNDYGGAGGTGVNGGRTRPRRGSLSSDCAPGDAGGALMDADGYLLDFDGDSDRDNKIQMLKDRFSGSKRNLKNKQRHGGAWGKAARRSSLSSYTSFTGSVMSQASQTPDTPDLSIDFEQHSSSDHNCNNSLRQQQSQQMHILQDKLSGSSGITSLDTLPVANVKAVEITNFIAAGSNTNSNNAANGNNNNNAVANVSSAAERRRKRRAKSDQIIESLVWFSFHTPRTVLEDLITHEMELWKWEQQLRKFEKTHSAKMLNAAGTDGNGKQQKGVVCNAGDVSMDNAMMHLLSSSRGEVAPPPTAAAAADLSDDNDAEDGLDNTTDDEDGSFSSLSDDGGPADAVVDGGNFFESMLRLQQTGQQSKGTNSHVIKMPKAVERESALLFVDMSGFTKLSTVLDVESLSKVINSYFDMIVSEVIHHGGDILKFAGDAFFAEWRVIRDDVSNGDGLPAHTGPNPLADLNASLASINEMAWDDDDDVPKLSTCVLSAAKCATAIVRKFSDYHVTCSANTSSEILNVHCGIGVGHLVGLHVGDYKEDPEEDAVELRREFLILGSAIDQVTKAADLATDGQVMASPEAILSLAFCCDVSEEQRYSTEPVCIASRDQTFLDLDPFMPSVIGDMAVPMALQPYESLRMHCKALNNAALARLHLQMALYVHPVIRGDELALSAAIQAGKISQPTETLESRHRAEAELRSVFTIFIKAVISPRVTGMAEVDQELYQKLSDIMHVTSRELDRYSGHLRQFIVDDKGVVLIATFGLRGSTFPNMVANNGLPATFAIHRALKAELEVESRIGATFGKVYCGVVGGVRRHEFAVMGAPVNLAARLMSSKVNRGILVDEAVASQANGRYEFNSLPPVMAKGYEKPVPILEPINSVNAKKKRSTFPFIGRRDEKEVILSISKKILDDPLSTQSAMVFLMGESGMGKTALTLSVMEEIKKKSQDAGKTIATARSTSTETEQRIPLSSYRKVFMTVIGELCEHDGTLANYMDGDRSVDNRSTASAKSGRSSGLGFQLQSITNMTRKGRQRSLIGRLPDPRRSKDDAGADEERPCLMRAVAGLASLTDSPTGKNKDTFDMFSQSLRNISADLHAHRQPSSRKLALGGMTLSIHGESLNPNGSRRGLQEILGQSLHRLPMARTSSMSMRSTGLRPSRKSSVKFPGPRDDSSIDMSVQKPGGFVPYFEKLCWVCEQLDYPYEYADIVGSQFLGLDGASPVTHVDGHIPTMDELVEFLALAFICIADYADLTVMFLDDFQWVDSFSWKIFRVLCTRGKKMLLICAMRSHDKQALRRLSTAATRQSQLQSQMVEISLGPLDLSEIRELMAVVLGYKERAISEALCTDIFQRTGGLPVYVVQVLENIKRNNTVELVENGMLQWNAEGLKEKRAMASNKTGAVMEETFLSRFDALDVRVRKVLQTCAVLGLSFALTDVVQVHPEMDEADIESALDSAIDEMILVEQVEEENDEKSLTTDSTGTGESDANTNLLTADRSRGATDVAKGVEDRFFQFSHAMWRKNVLTTMLKERKIEIHRLIAEAMEKDQVLILEESDISRLLTLFDHWKSCGDFCKSAPLALAVGSRLEEWDLSAQSLELYEDALEMSFDSVQTIDESAGRDDEWVQVSAKPAVLDLILRLHIRIGLCHQRLGDDYESTSTFEDAYNIIKTSSKIPGMSKSLMMPIISSLCVLKLEREAYDMKAKAKQEKLVAKFVEEAREDGNPIHLARALSMQATFFAKVGQLEEAVALSDDLRSFYDFREHSFDMVAEYGRDFAVACLSESVQWMYLLEKQDVAEAAANKIIEDFLPKIDPYDFDTMMHAVLPIMDVLKLLDRAKDAEWLLTKYIKKSAKENQAQSQFWLPLFTPLTYVLEVILMEDEEEYNPDILSEIERWVLDEENGEYTIDLERKAHTLMGELCWRLANFKDDDDDPTRIALLEKAEDLLTPIARYPHPEVFLKHTAQALLEAL